jgi:hypothetical protein
MDTIVIKLNQPKKAKILVEMLKSMDFISTVVYFDKYVAAQKLFEEVNKIAAASPLAQLSLEEINAEVMGYRLCKNTAGETI